MKELRDILVLSLSWACPLGASVYFDNAWFLLLWVPALLFSFLSLGRME